MYFFVVDEYKVGWGGSGDYVTNYTGLLFKETKLLIYKLTFINLKEMLIIN